MSHLSEKQDECATPIQKLNLDHSEHMPADVTEQLHSLRKEKSSLELQNCSLQINFEQVRSQLEAVLLYKEVQSACFFSAENDIA